MSKYVVDELSRVTNMALSDERLSQAERDDIKLLASLLAYYLGSTVPREKVRVSRSVHAGEEQ